MHDDLSTPFYSSLLDSLHRVLESKIEKEGPHADLTDYQDQLKKAMAPDAADVPFPLSEIIENYQHLFSEKGPVHLDKKLLEAFSPKEFALKVYRGLPRIYQRDNPAVSHVKKDFSSLPGLKRLAAMRFLLPLYDKRPLPPGSKVSLFTWVISDGWGDLIAAKEVFAILKDRFPSLSLSWIALVPKKLSVGHLNASFVSYEGACPPALLPEHALQTLRDSDLILSLPTFYPHMKELVEILQKREAPTPFPRLLSVGQYGYLESSWFHPKSGNHSMGLHFLERGILIRKSMLADFAAIENQSLLLSLFQTGSPGPMEVEKYLDARQFYLAYLLSPVGGAIYLHALLHSQIHDERPIDICTPDLGWFIGHVERQKKEGRRLLEGSFGVESIEVQYEGKSYSTRLAEKGKKVRILCPGPISDSDFRLLVRLSGEFVGVRGDQSFSEAVSANRAFFYDGAPHARYFVKDLLALAENRLAPHRSALAVFRGMGKAFLHSLKVEETAGEWVDETFFQEKEPWMAIAQKIGAALLDPDALAAFKKFNKILADEYACNQTLCQMVQRELALRASEELAQFEESQASLFANQGGSLAKFLSAVRGILEKK